MECENKREIKGPMTAVLRTILWAFSQVRKRLLRGTERKQDKQVSQPMTKHRWILIISISDSGYKPAISNKYLKKESE